MNLLWRSAAQGRVGPRAVVAADPPADAGPSPGASPGACLDGIEGDALVFQRPREALDEHVVHPPAMVIHGDPHASIQQHLCEARAGELAALAGVEDAGPPEPRQGHLQRLDAEVRLHGVGEPLVQNPAAEPIHDGDQIQEPAPHRDVSDVGAPDLIWLVDRHGPQETRTRAMKFAEGRDARRSSAKRVALKHHVDRTRRRSGCSTSQISESPD